MSEKFDDEFYWRLLDYLEEKLFIGFHWETDTYQEYVWWVEDTDLGCKGLLTLKELVEDVFSNIQYLAVDRRY